MKTVKELLEIKRDWKKDDGHLERWESKEIKEI